MIVAVALGAMAAFVSCSQEEFDAPREEKTHSGDFIVHFNARQATTKTVFGSAGTDGEGHTIYPTFWSANDAKVMVSLNFESGVKADVRRQSEGLSEWASFDASFDAVQTVAPYVFYLVSPSDAFLWPSSSREAVSVTIPGNQTPLSTSLDERAQIIVSQSESFTDIPANVDVTFSHITAYGLLTLKNVVPGDGVSVTGVELLSTDVPLAGSWYYNFADGSMAAKEASSSIVLDTRNVDVTGEGEIWFGCAPVNLSGKSLRVSVLLSDGKALVRTLTMKSGAVLASGYIYSFSVDMASAERVDNPLSAEEPVYGYSQYGAYLSEGMYVYQPATEQLLRAYPGDGTTTFSLYDAISNNVSEFSAIPSDAKRGDSFTLHVYIARDADVRKDADYSVRVLREEGARLWLGDAAGNGFIVKK